MSDRSAVSLLNERTRTETRLQALQFQWRIAAPYLFLFLFLLLVLLGTRSTFFGDTPDYATDISNVVQGYHPGASLLDFGHLVWRPLGAWVMGSAGRRSSTELIREAAATLIWINIFAFLLCAVGMWLLLRLIRGISVSGALCAWSAFIAAQGVLILGRSGLAYIPALTCLIFACCCSLLASRYDSWIYAFAAALLTAASVVFWVPYVLAAITVVSASLLAHERGQQGKRLLVSAVRILPLAAIVTIVAFAAAVLIRRIGNSAEFWAWVQNAAHNKGRDRAFVRMLFGLPRSFFIMGDDGVLWKQFLFHDRYAGVTLWDVLRASAWRIALFYAVMAIAILQTARTARWLLAWATAAVLPTIVLAVAFEAGSVERYMALYPAVIVVLAWLISGHTPVLLRAAVTMFCLVLVLGNLWASRAPRIDRDRATMMARLAMIPPRASSGVFNTVFVLNLRDDLLTLSDPADPRFDSMPQVRFLIPPTAGDVAIWKGDFASRTLDKWNRGGEVWISQRVWAEQPRREWCWVEADNEQLRWTNLLQFTTLLVTDQEVGGDDGFRRVARTPRNRQLLESLAAEINTRTRSVAEDAAEPPSQLALLGALSEPSSGINQDRHPPKAESFRALRVE